MTDHIITLAIVRNEVLREFAALTRHTPAALDARFICTLGDAPDADEKVLDVSYGKREAGFVFKPEVLDLSIERFCAEVARPLAKELLESA